MTSARLRISLFPHKNGFLAAFITMTHPKLINRLRSVYWKWPLAANGKKVGKVANTLMGMEGLLLTCYAFLAVTNGSHLHPNTAIAGQAMALIGGGSMQTN